MPKQKHLTIRYTIRLSEYLSNEMIKHTLASGQDYSSFIRMCIAAYLKTKSGNGQLSDKAMSATKTPISDVIDNGLPSVDMFGTTSPTVEQDEWSPVGRSHCGWD